MTFIYQFIYNSHINKVLLNINKFIVRIFPSVPKINPSGQIKIALNNDKAIIFNTNQTSHITYLLYWYGADNFEYSAIFQKLISKVNNFYDIGANIGYYSLVGAGTNPNLKVEVFEPSAGVLKILKKNIIDNNFELQISCNDLALSETKGIIEFNEIYNPKYPDIPNLSGEHNLGTKSNRAKKIIVQTDTLDNFYKSKNHKVDLIKIDTEGVENIILTHGSYLIEDSKPIIICETLFNKIEGDLEQIMISHGYEFYNHVGNHLEKALTIQREKDNNVRNCFFVHPSRFELIKEFVK